jgi:hypothetical protein
MRGLVAEAAGVNVMDPEAEAERLRKEKTVERVDEKEASE